jgi:hypothetical protein
MIMILSSRDRIIHDHLENIRKERINIETGNREFGAQAREPSLHLLIPDIILTSYKAKPISSSSFLNIRTLFYQLTKPIDRQLGEC